MSNNTRWINRAWPIHMLEHHSATLEKVPSEKSPRTRQDSIYGVLGGQRRNGKETDGCRGGGQGGREMRGPAVAGGRAAQH